MTQRSTRPLVVSGMHCSGTSMVAGLMHALGFSMGRELLEADPHNPHGYFEDVDFVAFQSRMTVTATPEAPGHRDWGWTEQGELDLALLETFGAEADALLARRAAAGHQWGWKNPRTTMALDFWDPRLPDARYLLVYRYPWEVADSMQRLGAEVFLRNPTYAYRIWESYNRRLASFAAAHPGRVRVVSANAILRDPEAFDSAMASWLGIDVPEGHTRSRIRPESFASRGGEDPLVTLLQAVRPGCIELLVELDALAAVSSRGLWGPTPRVSWDGSGSAPRVSVLAPCYDHGEFLIEAVASAERAALREPLEILVVDDGSREPWTLHVLERLEHLGYRVLRQPNEGLAAARNHGARVAAGDLLLPLDADNRIRPMLPELARKAIDESPEVGVVYSNRWDFGARQLTVEVADLDAPTLLRGNYIDACAVIRRQLWADCGGWDVSLPGWEDWELWLAALERGWRFRRLDVVGFDYRVRPGSLATTLVTAEVGRPLQEYIVRKHEALYLRYLPELLLETQHALGDLAQAQAQHRETSEERDRSAAQAARLGSEVVVLREHVEDLSARLAAAEEGQEAMRNDARRLSVETANLREERFALYDELSRWQQRVRAMESTAVWRFRRWALSLLRRR